MRTVIGRVCVGAFVAILLALNLVVLSSPASVEPQQRATGRWVDLGGDRGACVCPDWYAGCECLREEAQE